MVTIRMFGHNLTDGAVNFAGVATAKVPRVALLYDFRQCHKLVVEVMRLLKC